MTQLVGLHELFFDQYLHRRGYVDWRRLAGETRIGVRIDDDSIQYLACFKVFSDIVQVNEPVTSLKDCNVRCYYNNLVEVIVLINAHQQSHELTLCSTYYSTLQRLSTWRVHALLFYFRLELVLPFFVYLHPLC